MPKLPDSEHIDKRDGVEPPPGVLEIPLTQGKVSWIDYDDFHLIVGPKRNARSRYKGLSKVGKRWRVSIAVDGKMYRLGEFDLEKEAAFAYDVAAKVHHGEFARLNFPED